MTSIDNAKQKAKSVIEAINSIKELDFPYEHPLDAVNFIGTIFKEMLEHLEDISDVKTARKMCRRLSENMEMYLPAIEFMVRACDIRGPLELQGPLLRLTHQAIDKDVKLVISSEWRHSPSTLLYPDEFGNQFVLVGLPVSEAGNPLIAPLAGHELGHNIWRRYPAEFHDYFGERVKNNVTKTIKSEHWEEFSRIFNVSDKKLLDGFSDADSPWEIAKTWAASHCEEMFCDFIGLCIFGEAYLYAFQYLISPGGGLRNPTYPSDRARISALMQACKPIGIKPPLTFQGEFDESDTSSDQRQQLLLVISDKASQALVPKLIKAAHKHCISKHIINRNKVVVERIFKSFTKVIPATGAESLANIINAAWKIFLDNKNYWAADYRKTVENPEKRVDLIRELTLKSFEVFEIEKMQEDFDKRNENATISH
jgi:hypothetical protein